MDKRSKVLSSLVLAGSILALASGLAQASLLSWQTSPILGTHVSDVTGDVVVITGPQPMNGANPYYDVDGNVVLGPTIPHYSISGDPLEGIGSPSVSLFFIHPTTCCDVSGHFYDPDVGVYSGSGVNLDETLTYHYTGIYTFEGTLGNASYPLLAAENIAFTGQSFIMLMTGVSGFWPEDAGPWHYTETWTENATGLSISSTRQFDVVIPEPATLALLGIALGGLGFSRRKRAC